jgi:FkbM family methyltransferase
MFRTIRRLLSGRRRTWALNNIDVKLDKILSRRDGFFIEAGANNGRHQSNTLYFERYYGWTGILVEPIPELAQECKTNRPNCIVENCALVPSDYLEQEITMNYCGMMSMVEGAMKSPEEEARHLESGCKVQNLSSYRLTVPVKTLTSILDSNNVDKIDLLSLDVEGAELNVLKGLDLERFRPEYMLIEARYRDELDEYLAPSYKPVCKMSHHDVLYRNTRSAA